MSDNDSVVRIGTAMYGGAGFWHRSGSLVLYPDALAYAGSLVATTGGGGGLLGVLVARGVANARAGKKIAAGHKAVTTIPLADITKIGVVRSKRGKTRGLLVTTTVGSEYKFLPTKPDEWLADLSRVLSESGRLVSSSEAGLSVTSPP
jgi:hypothetical protein